MCQTKYFRFLQSNSVLCYVYLTQRHHFEENDQLSNLTATSIDLLNYVFSVVAIEYMVICLWRLLLPKSSSNELTHHFCSFKHTICQV